MVADDWVLDAVERQRVTYMAIICEGLLVNSDISMHDASEDLQGMGVSLEETQQMTECGELVARWADVDMRYWPELRIMKHGDREYLLLRHPSLKVDHVREGSRSHA